MEDAGSYTNHGNLSRKVVDIAAGESHTLLLTGKLIQYTSIQKKKRNAQKL
jgi:hypothetical protein